MTAPQPTPKQTPDMLTEALTYVQRGWSVFPLHTPTSTGGCSCGKSGCSDPGKHPRTGHGFKDATTDRATVEGWWKKWPEANIGIATEASGLVVVDVDTEGTLNWTALRLKHGESVSNTLTVATGGGGRHLIFESSSEIEVASSLSKIATGIDVKAKGGYIVAVPSLHESGRRYSWANRKKITPLPEELVALANAPKQPVASTSPSGNTIPEGQRNNTLTTIAGSLRREGKDESEMLRALLAENTRRCDPPLDEREVEKIARSVARYAASPQPDNVIPMVRPAVHGESRFSFYTDVEIGLRPSPPWILPDVIQAKSKVMLFGPTNVGKSFVTLDMALSIGKGIPWCGREVQPGRVLYVAAEAGETIGERVAAWKTHRGYDPMESCNVTFIDDVVQLGTTNDVSLLLHELETWDEKPVLVVIDPLHPCFLGLDENSSRDMGLVRAAADQIIEATGAAVLIVHHTGLEIGRERGSTAFRGGMETALSLTGRPDQLNLLVKKQRNVKTGTVIPLALAEVPGEASCVAVPGSHGEANGPSLPTNLRQALTILHQSFPLDAGAKSGEWKQKCEVGGIAASTFYKLAKQATSLGHVDHNTSTSFYTLTDTGVDLTTA
jgi:Bifunctional DNA primase/polymerase, N-terminal/AAA domain/Primase C terminal 1 (PriCT-1)